MILKYKNIEIKLNIKKNTTLSITIPIFTKYENI